MKYDYYIYDDGRVYSGITKKFLSKQLDKDGYEKVALISIDNKRHRYSVHRLLLENFAPFPGMEKYQVNHKDGNKQNNKIDNLEWATPSENVKHAFNIGLKTQRGEKNNQSKLTEDQVLEIIELLLTKKYTYKEIGNRYNVNDETIGSIRNKRNWKYLTENIDFS